MGFASVIVAAMVAFLCSVFFWLGLVVQTPLLISTTLPGVLGIQLDLKGTYNFGVVSRNMAAAACVLVISDVTGSRFPLSEEGEPLRPRIRLVFLCIGFMALWFYMKKDVLLEWIELVGELVPKLPRPRLVWPKDLNKMGVLEWTIKGTSLYHKHWVSKY